MNSRILHVGKFYPPDPGGMEVFLRDLVVAQRAAGDEAYALVHGAPRADDPQWLRRIPVQGHLIYAPIALGFRRALKRAIRDWAPDVLHLHLPNLSALWVLSLLDARDLPWVVHWHSDVVPSRIRGALALGYLGYRPLEQAVLDHAERIVVTSPPYLEASPALASWREKCTVVPLGLDVSRLPPVGVAREAGGGAVVDTGAVADEVEAIEAGQCATARPRLRLFSMGRLAYYKGFETLIEVVAGMRDVELTIAGDGELRAQLQALVSRHAARLAGNNGAIYLTGAVSEAEKARMFERCDVFCLASRERTEAFGIVLMEAMHFGKPCVVSDLAGSGMPWVVTVSQAGMCVPLEDVAAWRGALERMRDPVLRRTCGAAGREALAARFSMEKVVASLQRVYRGVCEDVAPVHPCGGLLVVIPAMNESATIGAVVSGVIAAGLPNVLVVDDQSTDDTAGCADAAGATVLRPVLRLGAWGAMQTGIRHALARGFDQVITMDADGQHEVAEIPALLSRGTEADVVIGAHPQRASAARRVAWGWFRRLSGFGLEDLTSGFRLYNHAAMKVAASAEATLLDYQDIGVLLLLRRAGLRIVEVPVAMNLRQVGQSRIFNSWWTVFRYMAATTLLCLSRWRVRARLLR